MKRTAVAFLFPVALAGFCGCLGTNASKTESGPAPFGQAKLGREVPGLVGPGGEPVQAVKAAGQAPSDQGVVRLNGRPTKPDADATARIAGIYGNQVTTCGGYGGCSSCGAPDPAAYGPMTSGFQRAMGRGGILPVPAMGPYGAVAAVGAIGANGSGMYPAMFANQRTSLRFANPAGMKVTWQSAGGSFISPEPLEAPARYNFLQGNMYRLKLAGIPKHPGKTYYPTLEIYPSTPKTVTFLSHNTVPLSFTDEDFDQVNSNNLVVKVVYLPDPQFQDLAATAGADEIVSTRLEPGVNPIDEANRRGTILCVVRIGNIDLQDPNTPAMDAPPGQMAPVPSPKMPTPMPSKPTSMKTPDVISMPSNAVVGASYKP